jgi:hypothetical protein
MDKLENLLDMMNGLMEMVTLENPMESDNVTAYNMGVEAMHNQVVYYIRNILGVKDGGRGCKGEGNQNVINC